MMKNLKLKNAVSGFLLLCITCTSCTKLEDTNYSTIVAEDFNATPDDVAALIGSGYIAWRNTFLLWNGGWRSQEVSADEIVIPARPNGWVDGGIYKRIHEHTWTPDDDEVYQGWYRTYAGITNCNKLLFQIESDVIPLSGDDKEQAIAEVRTLRASYYYILLDMYGNVPLSISFDVPEGYVPEQNSRQEVYNFVIDEITESLPNLNESSGQDMYGRFNKWAAYTLLAKIYLNAEVYTETPQWQECLEACQKVIDSQNYILESDQKNVFVTENQNSKEIIFALAIDENYTTEWNTFDIHMQSLQPSNQATFDLMSTPWGGMCAIPQFISTFDLDDERLTDNFIYGQQYSSSGDPLNCTLGELAGQPLAYVNEIPSIDNSQEIHGYRFGKFEIAKGTSNILNNDFPIFRYADVLMMKAECLLRTGHADEAAAIVSNVRERAFTLNPEKATVTGAQLLEGSTYDYGLRNENTTTDEGGSDIVYGRFLDELAWEFNQEGRRRQDMIRFGVFDTKSWFSHSPNGNYREIYPIPQAALNSNTNLVQNPGY